ncbi:hypothetical protein A1OQ_18040 [Enterovibrio norvegicus FF-162]|uniref:hypothetical protein n=1 Tax=Enterovibrio TaxID=188143 RepID=UPI00030CB88B|nr:hypothetical protein [Enterovibrio norvegicus]OEE85332.1 hypothetical protein A1OQ_18040 [Enterovibrio norvegicus FF-162]
MTHRKLSTLSLFIGLSILGHSSALYAYQAHYDDNDIDEIIQSLQKKEVHSDYKLFSLTQPEITFGEINQEGYENAIAIYHEGNVIINGNSVGDKENLQSVIIHEGFHSLKPELSESEVDIEAALYAEKMGINYLAQHSYDPISSDAYRPSMPNIFKNNLVRGLCRSGTGTALSAFGAFGLIGLVEDIYNSYIGGTAVSQESFNAAKGLAVPLSWAMFDYVLGNAQWVHGFPGSHASDGQRINDMLRSIPRVGSIIADTLQVGAFSERVLREELGLMMFVGAIGTNAMIQKVADSDNATAAAWPLKIVDTAIWGGLNGMVGEFVRYKNGGTYTALPASYHESLVPYLGSQKWQLLTSSINCGLAAYAGNQAWGGYAKWQPVTKNSTTSEYASSAYGAAAAYMGTWIAVDGVFKSMQYGINAGVAGFRDVVWRNFVQSGIGLINLAYSVEYHPDALPADTDYGDIPDVTTHLRKKRSTSIDMRTARMRKIFHELQISKSEALAAWERVTAAPMDLNNFQKVDVTRLEQDLALENSPHNTKATGVTNKTLSQLKTLQLSHLAKEAKTVTKVLTRNYADWRAWWNASSWENPVFCSKDGVLEYGQWLSNGGNITEHNCGVNSYGDGVNAVLKFNDGSMAMGINGRTIKSGEAWTIGANGGTDWNGYWGYAFFDAQGRPTAMAFTSKNWAKWGAGFSFLYKNGSWEYWKNDNWISSFSDGQSLDRNAPRFNIPAL